MTTEARSRKDQLKGSAILFFAAIIWGSAFVFQEMGADLIEPFSFITLRYFMGTLALLPVIAVKDAIYRKKHGEKPKIDIKLQLKAGAVCGVVLFVPALLQQIGLASTSAGKSGFITAMYIVMVPIIGLLVGKKPAASIWLAIPLAAAGLYLLCVNEGFSIATGDLITLASSFFWAIQIMAIDRYAPQVDCVRLACAEFAICGVLSLIPALLFEHTEPSDIVACAVPILYVGIMSCAVAFTMQPIGQRLTPPALAAIFMSLESVFAVLSGFLIMHTSFSKRELFGCGLMFVAVLLAQLDFKAILNKRVGRSNEQS